MYVSVSEKMCEETKMTQKLLAPQLCWLVKMLQVQKFLSVFKENVNQISI